MSEDIKTIGTELPKEMARVRQVIAVYRGLPNNAGVFGATMFEATLAATDRAIISGDLVAMIQCYQALKEIEL